jgi:hypothetical protein
MIKEKKGVLKPIDFGSRSWLAIPRQEHRETKELGRKNNLNRRSNTPMRKAGKTALPRRGGSEEELPVVMLPTAAEEAVGVAETVGDETTDSGGKPAARPVGAGGVTESVAEQPGNGDRQGTTEGPVCYAGTPRSCTVFETGTGVV